MLNYKYRAKLNFKTRKNFKKHKIDCGNDDENAKSIVKITMKAQN